MSIEPERAPTRRTWPNSFTPITPDRSHTTRDTTTLLAKMTVADTGQVDLADSEEDHASVSTASLDSLQVVAGSSPHKEAPRHLEEKKSPASGRRKVEYRRPNFSQATGAKVQSHRGFKPCKGARNSTPAFLALHSSKLSSRVQLHSKLDALSAEVASILSRLETVEDLCMYDTPFSLKEPSTDGRAPGIVKLDVFNYRAVDAMDAMDVL
eukprot:m.206408 g.206408  ORF g.206408 m.206408 type:complete len:210 (+) comp25351_c1_seq2:1012-1641(+)